jgi:phenylacetic acid degradation operon negative regulatory protein
LNRTTRKWTGAWIGVLAGAGGRTAKPARVRALRLLGFAELRPSFWVRPDNLAAAVDGVRDELRSLGLPAAELVFALRDLHAASEGRARGLWDVRELSRRYRDLLRSIDRSSARLEKLPAGEAMVESFDVGGRALRQLILDPLLPEEIHPTAERDALFAAMTEYDRLGRLAWAGLLGRFGVPHLRAPLDGRFEARSRAVETARTRGESNDDGRDAR